MEKNKPKYKLRNDFIFKKVFAQDENNSELIDLLEAILNIKIEKVEVKNPELPKNVMDEKASTLDIKAYIDNDTIIDIEMQVKNEYNIADRSIVYLSKLVAGQVEVGENYKKLKKSISIIILSFNYFETNTYHNIAHMKFEKTKEEKYVEMGYEKEQEIAIPKLEMHFIELPKFVKKNGGTKTKLEQWLWLISGREEKIKMAKKENVQVKKASEVLDKMNLTDSERELYEARELGLYFQQIGLANAEEIGMAKGEKIGEKRGKKIGINERNKEILKKLLIQNASDDYIIDLLEINKEELEKMKKELMETVH